MSISTIAGKALAALAIITAAAYATASPTQAATITTELDGCNPKGCYIIKIDGDILADDYKKFGDLIKAKNIKTAMVYLNSAGGVLTSGLIIGLIVKATGYSTYVPDEAFCASVCASIWLAGSERYASATAHVGFHQPYLKDKRTGKMYYNPSGIKLVKDYYAKIGIPKPAADFFVAADPKEIYWLNGDLLNGFGIKYTEHTIKPAEQEAPVAKAEPKPATPKATMPKALLDSITANAPSSGKL
jgi:hypothetical protein